MALILADADVLIDFLSMREPAASAVSGLLDADRLRITAVTCFELLSGATDGRRGDKVRQLAENLEVVPLDREGARTAARLRRQLEAEGQSIGMADSLIAGIALAADMPLFTRNLKHFSRIKDLRLLSIAAHG